ncbi:hypothetical protein ERHA54_16400 [Erwinia rhapontici]|nr:hypothetical protein ERHA54_16400 [Erwinia rhapontici]
MDELLKELRYLIRTLSAITMTWGIAMMIKTYVAIKWSCFIRDK